MKKTLRILGRNLLTLPGQIVGSAGLILLNLGLWMACTPVDAIIAVNKVFLREACGFDLDKLNGGDEPPAPRG